MPRIIVTTDSTSRELTDTPVLLDEQVHSVHLSTGHAAAQLVERLAWAVRDAENAEDTPPAPAARERAESARPAPASSPRRVRRVRSHARRRATAAA